MTDTFPSDVIPTPILPPRFPRIIYLNGPDEWVNNSIAEFLAALDSGITIYNHNQPLWEMADLLVNHFHQDKEPMDFLSSEGKESKLTESSKSWKIWFAGQKTFTRSNLGFDLFAQIAYKVMEKHFLLGGETIIFTQVETQEDLKPLTSFCSPKDQILIRLDGSTVPWENGSYIFPTIPSVTIDASVPLEQLQKTILAFLLD